MRLLPGGATCNPTQTATVLATVLPWPVYVVALRLPRRCRIPLRFPYFSGAVAQDLGTSRLPVSLPQYWPHVREDDRENPHIARRVGPENTDKPETALLKPLRFRRLLEADLPDERLAAFRRLAALASSKLNVGDLAGALLDWNEGSGSAAGFTTTGMLVSRPLSLTPRKLHDEPFSATAPADLLPAGQPEPR